MEGADHTEVCFSFIYLHSDTPYHLVPSQGCAELHTVLFTRLLLRCDHLDFF